MSKYCGDLANYSEEHADRLALKPLGRDDDMVVNVDARDCLVDADKVS